MFKKEQRFNPQQFPGGMMPGQMPGQGMPGQGMPGQQLYPQMQSERLQQEIMENRRRINNLAKRVARIESYLRIHDTPEYGYIEEDRQNNYSY